MNFIDFNLDAAISRAIPNTYTTPTPIQTRAIPVILEGKDIMGLAQTGTGKTAAFVLPILQYLIRGNKGPVRALVIAPTRELAEQIHEVFKMFGTYTGLKSTTIYGGVSMHGQIQRLRQGVDIVIACPGRLLDHLMQRTILLNKLEILVLDEADQMFDMGFFPTIRKIINAIPRERQTMLFSATMPSDIRRLAHEVLRNPVIVQVGEQAPVKTVAHALYPVDQQRKTDLLFELLKGTNTESVLIFTRTKHRAKRLGNVLGQAGYCAASLQGNLSQQKRQAAINGFRDGRYQILVATDIAARGIDVQSVSHVINYDIPDTVEAYTHRIGRTGRAERTGDAFTFVTPEDESMVRSIENTLGARIERRRLQNFSPKLNQQTAAKPARNEHQNTPRRKFRKPNNRHNKTSFARPAH